MKSYGLRFTACCFNLPKVAVELGSRSRRRPVTPVPDWTRVDAMIHTPMWVDLVPPEPEGRLRDISSWRRWIDPLMRHIMAGVSYMTIDNAEVSSEGEDYLEIHYDLLVGMADLEAAVRAASALDKQHGTSDWRFSSLPGPPWPMGRRFAAGCYYRVKYTDTEDCVVVLIRVSYFDEDDSRRD